MGHKYTPFSQFPRSPFRSSIWRNSRGFVNTTVGKIFPPMTRWTNKLKLSEQLSLFTHEAQWMAPVFSGLVLAFKSRIFSWRMILYTFRELHKTIHQVDAVVLGVATIILRGAFHSTKYSGFEILGISCDEWNSIFRFVGLTRPRSKFRAKIRDQSGDSFTFVYLLWGCSVTLKLQ